ncbi:MAG: hypothetical protein E6Q27_01520 [Aeromicrobium sp.]|nr:MAG: hypothetical protein E6Q27_01520 [Aeromicrobium sp.]
MISTLQAWLLVGAGIFNLAIWPRFILAIVRDPRAWTGEPWHSSGTSFLWVHAVLVTAAVTVALVVLFIGISAVRS